MRDRLQLVKVKDRLCKEEQSSVLYKIPRICYIGETIRRLGTRVKRSTRMQ
jgi:hypothetical protein